MEMDQTQSNGTALESVTNKINEGIEKGRYTWAQVQEAVKTKSKVAVETTDHYVHENPWQVIGIAAGLGLIVGLLLAPRD